MFKISIFLWFSQEKNSVCKLIFFFCQLKSYTFENVCKERERKAPECVPCDLFCGMGKLLCCPVGASAGHCGKKGTTQVSWGFRFRLKGLETSPSTSAHEFGKSWISVQGIESQQVRRLSVKQFKNIGKDLSSISV